MAECTAPSKAGWDASGSRGENHLKEEDHLLGENRRMSLSTCHSSSAESEGPYPIKQPLLNHGSSGSNSQQPDVGGFGGAPPGSLHSMRLLHDVQELLPGPRGAYAKHLMSFLQRRWWSEVRSRSRVRQPRGFEQDEGPPIPPLFTESSCRGSSLDAYVLRGICDPVAAMKGSFTAPHSPSPPIADPLSTFLHPPLTARETGSFTSRLGSNWYIEGSGSPLSHRPFLWRSLSCPGRLEDPTSARAKASRGRGKAVEGVSLFQSSKDTRDTERPSRNGRSKSHHQQQHQQPQQKQHQQIHETAKKSNEAAEEPSIDECDALLRKKLWTLGSLPDHAMVVKKPSQVGRLSSCILPSLGGPRPYRGEGNASQNPEPSGIKLLPVVTGSEDERQRRASVHVCLGSTEAPHSYWEDGARKESGGALGDSFQPHRQQTPSREEVKGRYDHRRCDENLLEAAPVSFAAHSFQPPRRLSGETQSPTSQQAIGVPAATAQELPIGGDCLANKKENKWAGSGAQASATPSRAAAQTSPTSQAPKEGGGKIVITSLSACSWSDPPTVRACPIQKYLAHTQQRDLGALCLGPPASAAEVEEERLVRCLSGCTNCDDPGAVTPERCLVDHKHNKGTEKMGKEGSGTRYQAMSDCLGQYPEILVQLLRGPLARKFPDADRLRLQRSSRAASEMQSPARTDLCLWIGAFGIPRDDKRYRGGEDAWFLDAKRNSFGVADGVSEWEDLAGINPQEYAQDLMKGTQEAIDNIQRERQERDANGYQQTNATETEFTPADIAKEALTRAYHKARNFGSSTAIVGVLDGKAGVFGLANLGDSSSLVLRRPKKKGAVGQLSVVKKVKEMQHGFNIPYQFAHLPAPEEWDLLLQKGLTRLVGIAKQELVQGDAGRIGDQPSAIQSLNVPVQDGDLVLLGTDGFFDNVFDFEVLALTGLAMTPLEAETLFGDVSLATPPEDVARALALAAYWRSLDKEVQTPFSKEARRCCNKQMLPVHTGDMPADASGGEPTPAHAMFLAGLLSGGKEDDITVAAAWVCRKDKCGYASPPSQSSPQRETSLPSSMQQTAQLGEAGRQERGGHVTACTGCDGGVGSTGKRDPTTL